MAVKETGAAKARDGSTLARVRSVSRAVAILRCFSPAQMQLNLGEISTGSGLDAGTVRRILVTLRDEGLIAQQPDGRYHMTMQMMRLASAVPEARSLRDLAEVHMRTLADETGLTVLLSVPQNKQAICIARELGNSPVQVRWWPVGEAMPLNCGAAPRLLLAYMPEADRNAVFDSPLPAMTRHSTTNPLALKDQIAEIQAAGWSLSRNDVVEGLSALAAPIHNTAGVVVGALSIGGLNSTITDETGTPQSSLLASIKAACTEISLGLR